MYSFGNRERESPGVSLYGCLFLVSAATLLLEISLTRIFSVTQGYHFAFLAISLALLGFGASGTALALAPAFAARNVRPVATGAAALFAVTSVGGMYVTNALPFDAYTLLWEPTQFGYLTLYYLALAVPFFLRRVGSGRQPHPVSIQRRGPVRGELGGLRSRLPALRGTSFPSLELRGPLRWRARWPS